ncbi:unnamed protein product [Arabidopsis halleri]
MYPYRINSSSTKTTETFRTKIHIQVESTKHLNTKALIIRFSNKRV